jgi:hypothetical protein
VRFFVGSGFGVALALAIASLSAEARACPPLPPGLLASARPLNLGAPVPSNGALVFRLECWHDCTPCAAAAQRLDITVVDSRGKGVRGDKPEQVFLTEDGLSHLVLWRPAEAQPPGDYQVTVGVRSQPETESYPLTWVAAIAAPDPSAVLTQSVTTYEVNRGTLYTCDQSQNDCDIEGLSFGSQYELLPELSLSFGAPSDETQRGQLLYHVMHHAADGTTHWGSWHLALDTPTEEVRFADAQPEYCADTEVRSVLAGGTTTAESPCAPQGDVQAPTTGDTDISVELRECIRPPSGLEPEWCAIHAPDCVVSDGSIACYEVAQWCVDPIERGGVGPTASDADTTTIEADELCPSPEDPYDESVAGCTCRTTSTRTSTLPFGWAVAAAALWLGRRVSRRVPRRPSRV